MRSSRLGFVLVSVRCPCLVCRKSGTTSHNPFVWFSAFLWDRLSPQLSINLTYCMLLKQFGALAEGLNTWLISWLGEIIAMFVGTSFTLPSCSGVDVLRPRDGTSEVLCSGLNQGQICLRWLRNELLSEASKPWELGMGTGRLKPDVAKPWVAALLGSPSAPALGG